MNRKSLTLIIALFLMLGSIPFSVKAQTARVYIDPPLITGLMEGDTFSVNVIVENVEHLYAWKVELYYRSAVLNATERTSGPIWPDDSPGVLIIENSFTDNYNGTHGLIHTFATFLGMIPGFDGTTVLETIDFKVKGLGATGLDLGVAGENTNLLDDSPPPNTFPIPHTVTNGVVRAGERDVAVIQVNSAKSIVNDTVVPITVAVANFGEQAETFDVTLYYDSTAISTQTVTNLAPETPLTLNFTWDTATVPKGNYTISAAAQLLPGELDTSNNNKIDGWIKETILGDVDGDGEVGILDVTLVAIAWETVPGNPRWNPNADLDDNGEINIIDITKVALEFGKIDP
ncbi:MAG TPA: CARDB domain-containing protein [Candidatus Bathyarchaeia archaeon]